ncbi:MAG: hypothetical protein WBM86_24365, partial [Waterburya sp.]
MATKIIAYPEVLSRYQIIARGHEVRSPDQKISLYSQAVSAEGGEDESGESVSERDFRGVGGEGVTSGTIVVYQLSLYTDNCPLKKCPENPATYRPTTAT